MNESKRNKYQVGRLVMRWRCGWCGAPTSQDGQPLAMSEIGLTKDIEKNWSKAELVNGGCCANDILNKDHYEHERRIDEFGV